MWVAAGRGTMPRSRKPMQRWEGQPVRSCSPAIPSSLSLEDLLGRGDLRLRHHQPTGDNWKPSNPGNSGPPYNTMIQITGGTVTMGPGVIVDAKSMCRCISVNTTDGAAKLVLDGTRIQNGALAQTHGAGIILQDGAELEAPAVPALRITSVIAVPWPPAAHSMSGQTLRPPWTT